MSELERHMPEVLREARLPRRIDVISDLQDRARFSRAPSVHEPEMPAMAAREELHHGRRLAMPAYGQNDTFVGPVHRICLYPAMGTDPNGASSEIAPFFPRRTSWPWPSGPANIHRLTLLDTRAPCRGISPDPYPSSPALSRTGTDAQAA